MLEENRSGGRPFSGNLKPFLGSSQAASDPLERSLVRTVHRYAHMWTLPNNMLGERASTERLLTISAGLVQDVSAGSDRRLDTASARFWPVIDKVPHIRTALGSEGSSPIRSPPSIGVNSVKK